MTTYDPIVIDAHEMGRRFGDLVAVKDVSFQVRRAAIFGLLGPNGSGKSTIIRMLLGILPLSTGEARVLGRDVHTDAESIKRRVGYMSQQFSLYADLTVRENIEFYGRIYGLDPQRIEQRFTELLELTGLGDRVDQLAGTLSGGWKQRLALACALVHEPELLFLDEPTAGIDPVARRQLWDLLYDLSAQGVTLFVTTHYMDEAERCTDVGYIYQSRLLVLGAPEQLKTLPQVNPQGTRRYELRVPEPARRLAELRAIAGVREASIFGETIHLLANDATSPESIVDQLHVERANADFREATPTLEDVFVTLTQAADRDGPPEETVELAGAEGASPTGDSLPPTIEADTRQPVIRPAHGLWAVMIKEFAHIRRQPSTLFFMLVVPVMQTIIFGYAIDTQIEHIPMVVFDLDGRSAGRELIEAMQNTRRYELVDRVTNEQEFYQTMTSGRAKVGVKIPPDYSDRLVRGEQTSVQVLIDGSDSQVATTALSTAQLLGLNLSIGRARSKGEALGVAPSRDASGRGTLPIDVRTRLLYNPDLKSAHFFVPGLVGIILQLVTLFLTSFAVVRERELGTLEQLFVTPVSRTGLLLGKLTPYALVGLVEMLLVLVVMIYVFGVPIRGDALLLTVLSMLFLVTSLGLGLLVSTLAKTQVEAMQFAFIVMLPSVLLSGFMFPRSEMPLPIYLATFAIPVTYFIEILRGIVLRGADLLDLTSSVVGLIVCGAVVLAVSVARFRKQLD